MNWLRGETKGSYYPPPTQILMAISRRENTVSVMISGSSFSLKGSTHSLFLWKAYIAHFLCPTSSWMKAGLWSLAVYCWDALKPTKALQMWDLLLGDRGSCSPSRWQVTARPHKEHAQDDDHICLSELGLVSKHTAAIKAMGFAAVASTQPAQTLILQSVNILVQSYYIMFAFQYI